MAVACDAARPPPLEILYRDDRVIAVDKPPGLLVHRSDVDRHAREFALQMLRDQIGRRVFPVHRLDRATSGLLLFALDPEAAAFLGRRFEAGRKQSRYLAMVRGHTEPAGLIDKPLSDPRDERIDARVQRPRSARTRFQTLARTELPFTVDRYPSSRYSLLAIEPETGRRHQIRRHLKHASHPIIGDTTYGKGRHNRFVGEHFGVRRLLLACVELEIAHPDGTGTLRLVAAPSGAFRALLARLDWLAELPPHWRNGSGRGCRPSSLGDSLPS